MHSAQRIVKYFAVALAFFIIAAIVSGVMLAASIVGAVFNSTTGREASLIDSEIVWSERNDAVSEIDGLVVNISAVDLKVEGGEKLEIETNNRYIESYERGGKLYVEEKEHNWLNARDSSEVVIRIPEKLRFSDVEMILGAGKVEIERISAETVRIYVGAGKTVIQELNASRECELNGGAGSFEVNGGSLRNLDLDMGVGKTSLKSRLLGESEISAGVGKLEVELFGAEGDYRIEVSKGLGSMRLNGNDVSDGDVWGSGSNSVEIDGGVGAVDIRVK